MISNLISLLIIGGIFIGLPLISFIIDRISNFIDKKNRIYYDIVLIPSGQVLKIEQNEFLEVKGDLIFWNNRIYEWTVRDNSYFANQLKRKNYNG